ncbi:MAG TPA: ATP-binding protein [Candidatus Anoxymicrobiaceae bacterium]
MTGSKTADSRVCILICSNFKPEARSILESEGLEDVTLKTFPAHHPCKVLARDELIDLTSGDYRRIHVLGATCISRFGGMDEIPDNITIHGTEQCFELFAGRELVDQLVREGAYLVTPGWLADWRNHIINWGFDRKVAREFFKESTSKIVLLDTGVDERATGNLEAFAEYVEMPYERIPVGLDMLRLLFSNIALEDQLDRERAEYLDSLSLASRQSADYGMLFDLISNLVEINSEESVIEKIFDLYSMLFAPSEQQYLAVAYNKPGAVYSRPEGAADPGEVKASLGPLMGTTLWTETDDGFIINIQHSGETLGIMEVSGIALPQYKDHYLNVAVAVTVVCGLAIRNARTYHELELANIELDGFAHTVSHDLKGPLSAMKLANELLQDHFTLPNTGAGDDMEADDISEIIAIIDRSVEKSDRFISEVLTLAEAGQKPAYVTDVDVREVVDGIAAERSGDIAGREIDLRMDGPLGRVRANPTHIYQVFANLLSNAIEHNDGSRPVIEVKWLGDDSGDAHRYLVRDNGSGIPAEDLAKVFVPFFKGSGGNTGMGLSTVRKIVKMYGGDVKAYNDNGACFEFTIVDFNE